MPDHDRMMALDVKLGRNGGSELLNREEMVALNVKLWRNDGSEHLNVRTTAPNAKL